MLDYGECIRWEVGDCKVGVTQIALADTNIVQQILLIKGVELAWSDKTSLAGHIASGPEDLALLTVDLEGLLGQSREPAVISCMADNLVAKGVESVARYLATVRPVC